MRSAWLSGGGRTFRLWDVSEPTASDMMDAGRSPKDAHLYIKGIAPGLAEPVLYEKRYFLIKTSKSIEDDTGIVAEAVAEGVLSQAERLLDHQLDDSLLGQLVMHAEATYQESKPFRAKIRSRGNRGRDNLWSYMQHWLASLLLEASNHNPAVRRILENSGFSVGRYQG